MANWVVMGGGAVSALGVALVIAGYILLGAIMFIPLFVWVGMTGPTVDALLARFRRNQHPYQLLDLPKTAIHYEIVEAPSAARRTILVIPDPPNTIGHFMKKKVLETLAKENDARVVCFDLPGFGFSFPKLSFDFCFEEYVESVEEFMAHLNKPPYVLAFSCIAGLLALRLAERNPQTVTQLILSQVTSFKDHKSWAWRMDMKGAISTNVFGQLFMHSSSKKIISSWFRLASASKEAAKEMTKSALVDDKKGACFCLASSLQKIFYYGKEFRMPMLNVPTLALWGCADRTHRRSDQQGLLQYINKDKVEFHAFKEIGHFPDLENPQAFCQYTHNFLSQF